MKSFLVVGVYTDNKQRYAHLYNSDSAHQAEVTALEFARDAGSELLIGAVLEVDNENLFEAGEFTLMKVIA